MLHSDRRRGLAAIVLPLVALIFQAHCAAAAQDTDALRFGVFPYLPPAKMEHIFAPIAARISQLTGHKILLRSRPDYGRFREQIRQQTYDIIFVQPFDYVRVAAPNGYLPLARWVSSHDPNDHGDLRAVMVTRSDAGIKTLADLEGRTVDVPNLDAAVCLLGRYALIRKGIHANIRSAGNHLACLQSVQVKHAAACITAWPPVKLFERKTGVKLRPLYETPAIPSTLFAVHKRVPASQRALIEKELLSWRSGDPATARYLSQGAWTRLSAAKDSDYDTVRKIWAQIQNQSR